VHIAISFPFHANVHIAELNKNEATSLINEAHISQPSCTAIQLALTDLLLSWGVLPTAVVGHSSGEIGAAYAAGILNLKSCMAISYYRGMATISLRKKFHGLRGTMMAVGGTKEEITPLIKNLIGKEARIACFNSPTSLTISGDEPAVDELRAIMEQKQMFNRKLQVDVAYHSHHMNLVAEEYLRCLQSLDQPKSMDIKFHSSLFGHLIDASELDPTYWVENLTQPVRFCEAVTSMCQPIDDHKTGVNMIIEIGPHSALAGPIKQIIKACGSDAMKIPYASALVRKKDAVESALDLASILFIKGATLQMGAINFPKPGSSPELLIDMPRYPWNHRTRYWHENRIAEKHRSRTNPRHDLLGTLANYSNDLEPTWRNLLRLDDIPWLRQHQIQSLTLFPISGFISMAVEAAYQRANSRNVNFDAFEFRDISVHTPLIINNEGIEMITQLRPRQESASDFWDEFRIQSWSTNKGWTEHCKGFIAVKPNDGASTMQSKITQISKMESEVVDKTILYDSLSDLGVSYGTSFQGMNDCWASDACSMANIMTVDTSQDMPQYFQTNSVIHPALLEQLIQMYWPILGAGRGSINTVYLPSSIGHMMVSRSITEVTKTPGDSLRAFCTGSRPLSHPKSVQMSMFAIGSADSEKPLIMIDDLTVSPILERNINAETEICRELCYKLDWEPILEPLKLNNTLNGHVNGDTNANQAYSDGICDGTLNGGITNLFLAEVVIIHAESESQNLLALKLAESLELLTGDRPEAGTLGNINAEGKICLFIYELEKPLLSTLTSAQFIALQTLLTNVQGILWVVRGAYSSSSNPDANMITGLSRSIRSETLLKFATLDLDPNNALNNPGTNKLILKVFKATFVLKAELNCELEFTERDGSLFTPRIINDAEMNEYVHKQTKGSHLESTPFGQEDRPLEMTIGIPGTLRTIHFIDQSIEDLLPDEIKVQVKSIGMNACDVVAMMGQVDNFGVECSGIVTELGKNVKRFAVGDRITGISVPHGVYSTYSRTKAAFAFKIRDNVSFEAAASIPVAYSAAYYGLIDLGRLRDNENVLIHGAETAAGQAAVCLAKMMGANIFALVKNTENIGVLKKKHGLRDNQISSNYLPQTNGKGDFDIVLNCSSMESDTARELWGSLNGFGRFVQIGSEDHSNVRIDTLKLGNRSFMSVDLISLAVERPRILEKILSDVSQLLGKGEIIPPSTTVFQISDVETAFQTLKAGSFDGKLIVSLQPEDRVKVSD